MSTPITKPIITESTPDGFVLVPRSKTLSVKNIPHTVWQRARQNALASNLSFGDYVVKLLGTAGPFPPQESEWDKLLDTGTPNSSVTDELSSLNPKPETSTEVAQIQG